MVLRKVIATQAWLPQTYRPPPGALHAYVIFTSGDLFIWFHISRVRRRLDGAFCGAAVRGARARGMQSEDECSLLSDGCAAHYREKLVKEARTLCTRGARPDAGHAYFT